MDLLVGKQLDVLVQPQPAQHLRHGLREDHHWASERTEQLGRLHGDSPYRTVTRLSHGGGGAGNAFFANIGWIGSPQVLIKM